MRIYLASTSPWRLELLRSTGLQVSSLAPSVREEDLVGATPAATASLRAAAKADAGWSQVNEGIVIGADQVAHIDGVSFGKPTDPHSWLQRLQRLRGREHLLTTAVSLRAAGHSDDFHVTTAIRFRSDLTDSELQAYVDCGEAAGCAGGYMMERRGGWLIESVAGDHHNIIGLPLFPLLARLRGLGVGLEQALEGEER